MWGMVPEIQSKTDRIFSHFGLFFPLFTRFISSFPPLPPPPPPPPPPPWQNENYRRMKNASGNLIILHVYQKSWSWCMFAEIWCAINNFFVILGHFLHFYNTSNPENKKNGKMYKMLGDIILLHMCTINEGHVMYGSWDTRHDGQSFLSFWAIFYPLTLLITQKSKQWKKWKNSLEILSFYTCVPQMTLHDVCFLGYEVRQTIFCHFGLFFALSPY